MTASAGTGDSGAVDRRAGANALAARYIPGTTGVLLTGNQAVGRLLAEQHGRDAAAGLRTAAFVSGYPGSPLGGLDRVLASAPSLAADYAVHLVPALNEELAATQVWGSQQRLPGQSPTLDGVVGVWYGKAPGLDRAGDAIRHGNVMGANPRGGVLVLVGDDPGAKSSTLPSASEQTLAALRLPVLFPRDSGEIVTLGLLGIAMSRASGCWVGMKLTADVADGFSSLDEDPARRVAEVPELSWQGEPWAFASRGAPAPPGNMLAETDLFGPRSAMVEAFAERNAINAASPAAAIDWLGIVAGGKAYDDTDQALRSLGLDEAQRRRHGIRLLRLGMISPLVASEIRAFARGLSLLLVIEEKAPFVETQVRDRLYGAAAAPVVMGKRDAAGAPLVPAGGELTAQRLREPLRRVLAERVPLAPEPATRLELPPPLPAPRTPYFCSGCPHNRSTVLPRGSLSGGGIGCHAMVVLIPRSAGTITGLTQMGGEGAQWIGQAPFHEVPHIFQNMGDGTYFHSGQLAIQACVAAGVNITYKILYNSAVAMTGGQEAQGAVGVPALTRKLAAEGVRRTIVCADEPGRYPAGTDWADGVAVWSRERLDEAQRLLRETPGVTALIYDQQCAAEARRLRKRGQQPHRRLRVVINEAVCEGCGDCGLKSNCLSVQPVETELGTKTRIDQASCNTDYSCLEGDCPAFVTMEAPVGPIPGAGLRAGLPPPVVPEPVPADLAGTIDVLLVGIGGTGVVTANQVLATAALLDGRRVKGVDQTGLSQKAGPVTSHLRFATEDLEPAGRIDEARACCLLAFDLLAAAEPAILAYSHPERTRAVVSTTQTPTGRMVFDRSAAHPQEPRLLERLERACRDVLSVDARAASETLAGDAVAANFLLVGVAVQSGALPLSPSSVERAIELNGVAVEANKAAFRWGCVRVADPDAFDAAIRAAQPGPPPARRPAAVPRSALADGEALPMAELRASYLVAYQGSKLAQRYLDLVDAAWRAERRLGPETRFSEAVARGAHHLMAYKDEYEVARLLLDAEADAHVHAQVPGARKVRFLLQPPMLRALGLQRKIRVGPLGRLALRALANGRRLRGTPLDPFGYARMRRLERSLARDYVAMVHQLTAALSAASYDTAVAAAEAALLVRGYEGVKLASVELYRQELRRLGLGRARSDEANAEAAA